MRDWDDLYRFLPAPAAATIKTCLDGIAYCQGALARAPEAPLAESYARQIVALRREMAVTVTLPSVQRAIAAAEQVLKMSEEFT